MDYPYYYNSFPNYMKVLKLTEFSTTARNSFLYEILNETLNLNEILIQFNLLQCRKNRGIIITTCQSQRRILNLDVKERKILMLRRTTSFGGLD